MPTVIHRFVNRFDRRLAMVLTFGRLCFDAVMLGSLLAIFSASTPAEEGKAICQKCNVMLLAFDAWSFDPKPGSERFSQLAPNLQKFFAGSYVFEEAISPSSWTFPTFFSLLSATYPSFHGMTNHYDLYTKQSKIPRTLKNTSPHLLLLSDELKKFGYRTGAFTGGSALSAKYGYNQGFDKFYEAKQFGSLSLSGTMAAEWIAEKSRKPFFAFVHAYDMHGQGSADFLSPVEAKKMVDAYVVNREETIRPEKSALSDKADRQKWIAWHEQKLAMTDKKFGVFLKALEKIGALDHTIFVVLSDHGSEIFEHGGMGHGHSLYEELIRVPLVIKIPKENIGRIITNQMSLIDVAPTLLEVLGLNPSMAFQKQIEGKSRLAEIRAGKINSGDVFSETEYRDLAFEISVRTSDHWKLIYDLSDNSQRLFQLSNDPGETKNLAEKEKNISGALLEKIELFKHRSALRKVAK